MAACRGIHQIFDNQIPENLSSFIDSLSSPWSKIRPPNPIDHHSSFTEIFGELHFKEDPSKNNVTHQQDEEEEEEEEDKWRNTCKFSPYHKRSESSSSMTEGLGFESLDNLEDLKIMDMDFQSSSSSTTTTAAVVREKKVVYERAGCSRKELSHRKKGKERDFPPPISSIGGGSNNVGKPSVCFESYREDGRFILKEVRIPNQECLHACREDGRLRLCFVQQSDDKDGFELGKDDPGEEEEEEEEEGEGEGIDIHGDEEQEEEKAGKT